MATAHSACFAFRFGRSTLAFASEKISNRQMVYRFAPVSKQKKKKTFLAICLSSRALSARNENHAQ